MSVLGIDPGTSRWGFVLMENGMVIKEDSVPTEKIKNNPEIALDMCKDAKLIVAPSGYGTVMKKVSQLNDRDFKDMLLKREEEGSIMGLEKVLMMMADAKPELNAYVIPGVKLLPTVPKEKKKGVIDMGTPDKLCAAVAGIVDQSKRLKLHYKEASFILAEIGYGFDAFIAVDGGRIVDGIGGTMASSTWRGEDGEILHLKGLVSKNELKKNGLSPEKVREGALKDIKKLMADFGRDGPKEILVSGSKAGEVFDFLSGKFKDVRLLNTCNSGNAAYGAAVIADGLAGGKFKEIVELIQLKKAKGGSLDFVDLNG